MNDDKCYWARAKPASDELFDDQDGKEVFYEVKCDPEGVRHSSLSSIEEDLFVGVWHCPWCEKPITFKDENGE